MRNKDIKIGQYYYVVHDIEQLYWNKSFRVKCLIEKFKMTKDIAIIKPRKIFSSYILAKITAMNILDKFRDKQIMIMNRLHIADCKRGNFHGIPITNGVDK